MIGENEQLRRKVMIVFNCLVNEKNQLFIESRMKMDSRGTTNLFIKKHENNKS